MFWFAGENTLLSFETSFEAWDIRGNKIYEIPSMKVFQTSLFIITLLTPFWMYFSTAWLLTRMCWFTSHGTPCYFKIVHWITSWCSPVERYLLCTTKPFALSWILFITVNVLNSFGNCSILYSEFSARKSKTNRKRSWCDLSLLSVIS